MDKLSERLKCVLAEYDGLYGSDWAPMGKDALAEAIAEIAALRRAIELALPAVEWMADAVDADPEDEERLAQINALLNGGKP